MLWSKSYSANSNGNSRFFTQTVLDTDSTLACAFDNNFLAKIDASGNVQFTTRISKKTGSIQFLDLRVLDDGDKVVLVQDQDSNINSYILIKISADFSKVLWTKYFSSEEAYYKNILVDGKKLILAGFISFKSSVLCFSSIDGSLVNQNCFRVANRDNTIIDIFKYTDGYMVWGHLYRSGNDSAEDNKIIVRMSPNLEPLKAYRFKNIDKHLNLSFFMEPDGSYYCSFGWNSSNLMRVSKSDSVLWSRTNNAIPSSTPIHLIKNDDGLIISSRGPNFSEQIGGSSWYFGLAKSDLKGTFINCPYYDNPVSTLAVSFKEEDYKITAKDTSLIILSSATTNVKNISITQQTTCLSTFGCNKIEIIGKKSICSKGQIEYTARRNKGCPLPVEWTILGDPLERQELNDSTIAVRFLNIGVYKFIAKLTGRCNMITDTMEVKVVSAPIEELSLGADTTLCSGSTILLNAHKGYKSYLWQDKSTNSTYSVTHPGAYYVSTVDACGNTYKDTIVVTASPSADFDLGPDLIICSGSSLLLQPPGSYYSYLWSTGGTEKTLTVKQPDSYWLEVKDINSCIRRDTITIGMKQCTGLFVPNAFTPNEDGINDVFKPLFFQNVITYHFIIYNRWGEKVFESTTPAKGWVQVFVNIFKPIGF